MAEKFSFFDPVLHDGLPDREYNAQEFTDYFGSLVTTGIMKGAGAELKVTANGSNMVTEIDTGIAFIEGRFYANTSKMAHTHDTESLGKSRIDRIVIRLDLNTEARHVRSFVKKGVGSATPMPPALTRNDKVYEISVAQVKVIGGQTYINASDVIDERENESVCGWAGSKILPNFDAEGLQAVLDKVNGLTIEKLTLRIHNKASDPPSTYDTGVTVKKTTPEDGYPSWGETITFKTNDESGILQIYVPHDSTGGWGDLSFRMNRKGYEDSWGDFRKFATTKLDPEVLLPLNAGYAAPEPFTGIKPLSFFKDPFGIVHLQGYVHKNSGAGTIIGVLPVGYRPDREIIVYGTQSQANESNSGIYIRPNGDVAANIIAPGNSAIFITFRAYN